MANFFTDYIFGLFPKYFKLNDSYKDTKGKGILERYLSIFGMELDNEVRPFIDNFLDIVDVTKCSDKFLPFISGNLGYIPSFGSNASYRKVLAYAISIYKCKGTKRAFEILYNILGYTVTIVEIQPPRKVVYDSDFEYDHEPAPDEYDSECSNCTDFYIAIYPNNTNILSGWEIDGALNIMTARIIPFLTPINAKFKGLIKMQITPTDSFDISITDQLV